MPYAGLGTHGDVATGGTTVAVTLVEAEDADPALGGLVGELAQIHERLCACADLRPGAEVNALFGRLVRLVVTTPLDRALPALAHPDVRAIAGRLRALCCQSEYELELHWARRIAQSCSPRDELARFPYTANYRELSRMERAVLADGAVERPVGRVAFVGSGPLPLTSFQLAADLGVAVHNLDRDEQAIAASTRLAAALGVEGVSFHHIDVGPATDLAPYDLVVLAALVGPTPDDKRRVLSALAASMAPGALLLARSARGLRTLLYPAIDVDGLVGFDVLGVVHPVHEVINSVILARKPVDR
jgi:hypothetical protein